jgi:hypothetical protein
MIPKLAHSLSIRSRRLKELTFLKIYTATRARYGLDRSALVKSVT